jgi:hypothetical protein
MLKPTTLLAVKDNQPTLYDEIENDFATAPAVEIEKAETIGKGHGPFGRGETLDGRRRWWE